MRAEIRRERLEGGGFGDYIDMWITAKDKGVLCKMEAALMDMGYQQAVEETENGEDVCWYFAVSAFDVPTVKEVRGDFRRAKAIVKEGGN